MFRISLVAAVAWLLPSLGFAQEPFPQQPSEQSSLEQRLQLLEAELKLLKEQNAASQAHPQQAHPVEPQSQGVTPASSFYLPPPPSDQAPSPYSLPLPGYVNPGNPAGYPELLSQPAPPKYPTVELHGFFHVDGGWFHQDDINRATLDATNPGRGDLQDVVGFRRARLGALGKITEEISYMIELDFAASVPLFTDLFVNIADVPVLGNVRVGRWRQPFGMSELTSAKDLPFLERSLVFPFSPFRQTGIGFWDYSEDERMTWAVSGSRYNSDNLGNVEEDQGGYALTGRWTGLPLYDEDQHQLIHLGLDYAVAEPNGGFTRFFQTPEFQDGQIINGNFLGVPPFVDTGLVAATNQNHFGVELAGANGPFSFQSEFRWLVLNQTGSNPTEVLPGGYALMRYTLTGERLPYLKRAGVFGRIVPDNPVNFGTGDWGAWEVAARWSYLDLNGTGFPGPGRRLNDTTLGLNWYWNAHLKFQLNWIHAFLDDPTFGDSNADVFAVRGQLDF